MDSTYIPQSWPPRWTWNEVHVPVEKLAGTDPTVVYLTVTYPRARLATATLGDDCVREHGVAAWQPAAASQGLLLESGVWRWMVQFLIEGLMWILV